MNIKYIEDRITELGTTKAAIAEDMKMSKQSFNALLKSDNPTLQKIRALAAVLGVSISQLLGETCCIQDTSNDFAAFVRFGGEHLTADTLEEFWRLVDKIETTHPRR